jgi:2-oxo-4-hydroxy-4-carboxy-5-ureidoimidazoline decarboxylase
MPFIICVRRHGKASILRNFERRLENSSGVEQEVAITEIFRIAALRLDERIEGGERLPVHGHLSTHVLDTHHGQPASGLVTEFVELVSGEEQLVLKRVVTNRQGRTDEPLIGGRPLPIGRYAGAVRACRTRRTLSRAAAGHAVELHHLPRQLIEAVPGE